MVEVAKLKQFFPLRCFQDVERLFEYNLSGDSEPNLAFLSIIAGLIEHSLTRVTDEELLLTHSRPVNNLKNVCQRQLFNQQSIYQNTSSPSSSNDNDDDDDNGTVDCQTSHHRHHPRSDENLLIPGVDFDTAELLYRKFVDQIKKTVDIKPSDGTRPNVKIKKISDALWSNLSNSYYKDKAHLQSVYSYLTTHKLDCFGLAFAVISGCQILKLENTYLALSEDHAWVMYNEPGEDESNMRAKAAKLEKENGRPVSACDLYGTCEVTWHGKSNSDKRGQPVVYKNCWLYTNGFAVRCDARMCVAALVSSINPSINTTTDSEALAFLQQRLLWLLFKRQVCFPMSLGNLGEHEDICPTPNASKSAYELFHIGIEIARRQYNDSHVYPYTYLAGYFYRHGRFKEALETWEDASNVMIAYNYSRDDEQVYNEFKEIANDLIPSMLKIVTAGGLEPGQVSKRPFLLDPECLALILKFYDNICCWEEGSSTPVLHIGWAKSFVATILKFKPDIRCKVKLMTEQEEQQHRNIAQDLEANGNGRVLNNKRDNEPRKGGLFDLETSHSASLIASGVNSTQKPSTTTAANSILDLTKTTATTNNGKTRGSTSRPQAGTENVTMSASSSSNSNSESAKISQIADACNERLLNPKFLLGNDTDSSLFSTDKSGDSANANSTGGNVTETGANKMNDFDDPCQLSVATLEQRRRLARKPLDDLECDDDYNIIVVLRSHKMAGARDLLQAERLNTSAIQLQLTAQSQCTVGGTRVGSLAMGPLLAEELALSMGSTVSGGSGGTARTSKRLRTQR